MKKKIIFNYLPPSGEYMPSSTYSLLKSFLKYHNYQSSVIYWNILLDNMLEKEKKIVGIDFKNIVSTFPYLYMLCEEYKDKDTIDKIVTCFNHINSNNLIGEELISYKDYNHKKLIKIKNKTKDIIQREFDKINFDEILLFGISGLFYQWIPGYIIANEVKKEIKMFL